MSAIPRAAVMNIAVRLTPTCRFDQSTTRCISQYDHDDASGSTTWEYLSMRWLAHDPHSVLNALAGFAFDIFQEGYNPASRAAATPSMMACTRMLAGISNCNVHPNER